MSTKPKMTAWFPPGTKPLRSRVGEYNASMGKARDVLRWWNGVAWSQPYTEGTPADEKARKRAKPSFNQGHHWRGLAADPAAAGGVLESGGLAVRTRGGRVEFGAPADAIVGA